MKVVTVIPISKGIAIETLTYFSSVDIALGSIVKVPMRKKEIPALVVDCKDATEMRSEIRSAEYELKKVDPESVRAFLQPAFLRAATRSAFWHASSTGSMLNALLPNLLLEYTDKHANKLATVLAEPAASASKAAPHERETDERLQEHYVLQADDEERLAHYKSLIREAFARRSSVFFCLPTIQDIENAFPKLEKGIEGYCYAFHGDMSKKEFAAAYEKLATETHPVLIVGTPQFLCLPRTDISTLIVDKENARGYKTQSRPYADMRVFAEHLSEETGAKLILGDVFLQTETMQRYQRGELHEIYPLKFRSLSAAKTEIVDMRPKTDVLELTAPKAFTTLSDELIHLIERTRDNKERLFMYAARKGLSSTTVCADCGTVVVCGHCGNPTVLHGTTRAEAPSEETDGLEASRHNFFLCHTCGERRSALELCHTCGGWRLVPIGIGIERIAQELAHRIPDIKVFMLNKDVAETRKKALAVVDDFYKTSGSILLGTEMALPYLNRRADSPRIENAAIAAIDSFFSIPDFKIPERVLAIILATRSIAERRMLIQTRMPDQQVFRHGADGNLADFYREELAIRKTFGYPPFSMLIKISIEGERDAIAVMMGEAKELFAGSEFDIFPSFIKGRGGKSMLNGLLRVPRKAWPDAEIIRKLLSLQPQFTIKVDPESLL